MKWKVPVSCCRSSEVCRWQRLQRRQVQRHILGSGSRSYRRQDDPESAGRRNLGRPSELPLGCVLDDCPGKAVWRVQHWKHQSRFQVLLKPFHDFLKAVLVQIIVFFFLEFEGLLGKKEKNGAVRIWNKPGTAQVGTISKAQKDSKMKTTFSTTGDNKSSQKTKNWEKNFRIFFEILKFPVSRIVPKNVKGGRFGIFWTSILLQNNQNWWEEQLLLWNGFLSHVRGFGCVENEVLSTYGKSW